MHNFSARLRRHLSAFSILLNQFGFAPLCFVWGIKSFFSWYLSDFFKLKKKQNKDFKIFLNNPRLHDKFDDSGTARGHYFHQDLLVAQKIFQANPQKHVDIWRRVDGFVAHVASFSPIEVFDIRKQENKLENIEFIQGDLTQLDEKYKNYTNSVSSLHAIEHFWLGRYGDKLDIDGHLKGLQSIYVMLRKWGTFYFSVPIWPQRIEFNGHRVFSLRYLLDIYKDIYILKIF
jgi:SAM-dependent methyltransferase